MGPRQIFLFLAALLPVLASQSTYGASPRGCLTQLLQTHLADLSITESRILAKFDPATIRADRLSKLSDNVYKLGSSSGHEYVLRLPGYSSQIEREKFAADFINRTPHLETPEVWVLDAQESQVALSRLKAADPDGYEDIVAGWNLMKTRYTEANARVSVVVYAPAQTGRKSLAQMGVTDSVRELIGRISQPKYFKTKRDVDFSRALLTKFWDEAAPETLAILEQDLKSLIPSLKNLSREALLNYLLANMERIPGSSLRKLTSMGFERITPELKTQLADYWITYSILGIPDFHPNNWLIHEGKVIAIDVAHPAKRAKKGKPALELQGHQHPYGFYGLSQETRETLMSSASPELKQYLKTLTREDVARIAKGSGYRPSPRELDAVMERIEYVNAYSTRH